MKFFCWLIFTLACAVAVTGCSHRRSGETGLYEDAAGRDSALYLRNGRLFLPAVVNGRDTQVLLDSGAEISLLDAGFAQSLGLATAGRETVKGSGGTDEVSFASGVSVAAIGLQLDELTVAVLDLTDISERLIGESLTMILGREIFDAARLRIDIRGGSIAVSDREVQPQGEALTLVGQHGIEAFPVILNGAETALAEFDLGNGGAVMIGPALAEKLGFLAEDKIVGRRSGGGIGGAVIRDIVIIPALTVGGVTFENVEAAIDRTETAAEINLGLSILQHFLITTDFSERRIWLQPY